MFVSFLILHCEESNCVSLHKSSFRKREKMSAIASTAPAPSEASSEPQRKKLKIDTSDENQVHGATISGEQPNVKVTKSGIKKKKSFWKKGRDTAKGKKTIEPTEATETSKDEKTPQTETAKRKAKRALKGKKVLHPEGENKKNKLQKNIESNQEKKKKYAVENLTVYIGGLCYHVEEETVKQTFGECGEIVSIRFPTCRDTGRFKGCCFINYADMEAVAKALELNETTFSDLL